MAAVAAAPGTSPRSPSVPSPRRRAPIEEPGLVEQLCGSWAARLLDVLGDGPRRFGALQAALPGISHKVLTQNLRRLARDGLVVRTQTGRRPLAVEYSLTDLGAELGGLLARLRGWAEDREAQVRLARDRYDGAVLSPR